MTAARRSFLESLEESIVLFDGAMGTELYRRGIFVNRCFDELTLSSPDLIRQVHLAYADVGADVIETNSFGANRVKLTKYGFGDQTAAINHEAARIARGVAGDALFVAGAIGPLGIRIEPWGPTSIAEAEQFFREQAAALSEGGVDLFMLETFTDLNEIHAAIRAVRSVSSQPLIASMTIEEDGNSLEGTAPEVFASRLASFGADVIGVNCSVGPAAILTAIERMADAEDHDGRILAAMPNAGRPRNIDGRNLYLCSPDYMGSYARRFVQAGARIVGGCCGTTPEHVRAMKRALRTLHPAARRSATTVTLVAAESPSAAEVARGEKSDLARALVEGKFALCAEVLPPRGWDASGVIQEARIMKDHGVDALVIPERPTATARMTPQALAQLLQKEVGIEAVVEYCCRDRGLTSMQSDLLGAWVLGIRNLALVTGDVQAAGDYPGSHGAFDVDAIGLTNMVHRLNRGIDIGGNPIGSPTAFHIGVWVNPGALDQERELSRYEWKIDAGAEYAFTHPLFDVSLLERFLEKTVRTRVPLIVSIVPLASVRDAEFLSNELPDISVPESILERMRSAEAKGNAEAEGVLIARELLERIRGMVEGALLSVSPSRSLAPADIFGGLLPRTPAK